MKNSIVSEIGTSSSSSDEKPAGDFTKSFTDTGFKHSVSGTGMNTVNTFSVGLNLDVLTGIDALKEVEATITSKRRVKDADNNVNLDVLDSVNASLRVKFIAEINVSFTANVKDAEFDATRALNKWNSKANSAFNAVTLVTIPSSYYNNPNNPYITTESYVTD